MRNINTRRKITLKNGQVINIVHDAISCPICLNGSMLLKDFDNNNVVLECTNCDSKMTIPYINCDLIHLDENDANYIEVKDSDPGDTY